MEAGHNGCACTSWSLTELITVLNQTVTVEEVDRSNEAALKRTYGYH